MITRIVLSDDICAEFGLRTRQIDGLGPLVVLTGPNGGGKTRYFRALERQLSILQRASKELAVTGGSTSARHAAGHEMSGTTARIVHSITRNRSLLLEAIGHIPEPGWLGAIALDYHTESHIPDLRDIRPRDFDELLSSAASGGYDNAHRAMPAILSETAQLLWNAGHPAAVPSEQDRAAYISSHGDAIAMDVIVASCPR